MAAALSALPSTTSSASKVTNKTENANTNSAKIEDVGEKIAGENGEVSTASVPTQINPTFSREDLGAAIYTAKLRIKPKMSKQSATKLKM